MACTARTKFLLQFDYHSIHLLQQQYLMPQTQLYRHAISLCPHGYLPLKINFINAEYIYSAVDGVGPKSVGSCQMTHLQPSLLAWGRKDNVFGIPVHLHFLGSTPERCSPVAKPQIFGQPCNTVRTKFFAVSIPPRCAV